MTATKMRPSFTSLLLSAALLTPSIVSAETITFTGKLNGLECAIAGDVCPIDKLDPHLALESDFVLQKADGTHYLLPNVPRDTKVRYVLEDVQVTGDLNQKYNAIKVDEFQVRRNSAYKTVWSQELQARAWEDRRTPGSTRP